MNFDPDSNPNMKTVLIYDRQRKMNIKSIYIYQENIIFFLSGVDRRELYNF
jgi:hypothetical protein